MWLQHHYKLTCTRKHLSCTRACPCENLIRPCDNTINSLANRAAPSIPAPTTLTFQELRRLDQALAKAQQDLSEARQRLGASHHANEQLLTDKAQMAEAAQQLQADKVQLEEAARKLRAELEEATHRAAALTGDVSSKATREQQLRKEVEQTHAAMKQAEGAAAAVRAERDALHKERDGLLKERDGLHKEQDGLLKEREALQRWLGVEEARLLKSVADMASLERQLKEQALAAEAAEKARAAAVEAADKLRLGRPKTGCQTELSSLDIKRGRGTGVAQVGPDQRLEVGQLKTRQLQTDEELWTRGKVKERGAQTDPSLIGWFFRNMKGKVREMAQQDAISGAAPPPPAVGGAGKLRAAQAMRARTAASAPGELPTLGRGAGQRGLSSAG